MKNLNGYNPNGLWEVLFYDGDSCEKQWCVVRGYDTAEKIVKSWTKHNWLGSRFRGFHTRPVLITEEAGVDDLMGKDDDPVFVTVTWKKDYGFVEFVTEDDIANQSLWWDKGSVTKKPDGTVRVCTKAAVSDFKDCHSKRECEVRAREITKRILRNNA